MPRDSKEKSNSLPFSRSPVQSVRLLCEDGGTSSSSSLAFVGSSSSCGSGDLFSSRQLRRRHRACHGHISPPGTLSLTSQGTIHAHHKNRRNYNTLYFNRRSPLRAAAADLSRDSTLAWPDDDCCGKGIVGRTEDDRQETSGMRSGRDGGCGRFWRV